ncbi:MAG TPA: hypothetical protein DCQ31_12600 [Bacteroidales bacterium]|nr:hypothetical protein [Bacteroidales bacterium]
MTFLVWGGFILLVFIMLAFDLGFLHKNAHEVKTGEALKLTVLWIAISLLFNVFVYFAYQNNWLGIGITVGDSTPGAKAALDYFTGYLIEKSLSLDNIFVIALIFAYFNIPKKNQHRILFWGILGALIFRGLMIGVGTVLLHKLAWITYFFGVLLLYSAYKMLHAGNEKIEPDKNPLVRFVRKFYAVDSEHTDGHFFTRINGKRAITIPFITLLVIETTDVMFAVDSIPAIFAITTDAFIVFTSNIFAILGLRSLYFVLASVLDKFKYLQLSLVFILAFVGVKMLLIHYFKFPAAISLTIIALALIIGIFASIYYKPKKNV